MVAIRSDKALKTTIVTRGFMDEGAECMKVGCRMDCMTLSIVGILICYDNGWAAMIGKTVGHRGSTDATVGTTIERYQLIIGAG